MDNNKKELISLILDRMAALDSFEKDIIRIFNFIARDNNVIDDVSDIAFIGIPLILEIEGTDEIYDLIYAYISKKITLNDFYKKLEKYLKEIK